MEIWEHGEIAQLDVRGSGETRALCYFKGYLYSGHTDATIKVLIVLQFCSVFLARSTTVFEILSQLWVFQCDLSVSMSRSYCRWILFFQTWAVTGRTPHVLHEVREHSLAVLCLTGWEIESKMFSGSADKTVRVWSFLSEAT